MNQAYQILGLSPGASEEQIKKAYSFLKKQTNSQSYKEKARQLHPDKNPGREKEVYEQFHRIQKAYRK